MNATTIPIPDLDMEAMRQQAERLLNARVRSVRAREMIIECGAPQWLSAIKTAVWEHCLNVHGEIAANGAARRAARELGAPRIHVSHYTTSMLMHVASLNHADSDPDADTSVMDEEALRDHLIGLWGVKNVPVTDCMRVCPDGSYWDFPTKRGEPAIWVGPCRLCQGQNALAASGAKSAYNSHNKHVLTVPLWR